MIRNVNFNSSPCYVLITVTRELLSNTSVKLLTNNLFQKIFHNNSSQTSHHVRLPHSRGEVGCPGVARHPHQDQVGLHHGQAAARHRAVAHGVRGRWAETEEVVWSGAMWSDAGSDEN